MNYRKRDSSTSLAAAKCNYLTAIARGKTPTKEQANVNAHGLTRTYRMLTPKKRSHQTHVLAYLQIQME